MHKLGNVAVNLPSDTYGTYGIDAHVERLADQLTAGGVLGLYGPGGVGKTTLATALYNKLLKLPRFRPLAQSAYVQLAEVVSDKEVKSKDELMCLNELLSQMPGSKQLEKLPAAEKVADLANGRPLLLLFDNVWDRALLERLLAHFKSRSTTSVIIATSRSTQHLLQKDFCSQGTWLQEPVAPIADPKVQKQILGADAGMSFGGLSATARQHLDSILEKSSGFPLALQAVGGYIKVQKNPNDDSCWQAARGALERIDLKEGDPSGAKLRPIVQLTLTYLDDDKDSKPCTNMFLDVAAVLAGEAEAAALYAWGALYPCGAAGDCLRRLVEGCLISIAAGDTHRPLMGGGSRLVVHDLILTIGRSMISYSPPQERFKRIWAEAQLNQAYTLLQDLPKPLALSGTDDVLHSDLSDSNWLQICMLEGSGTAANHAAPVSWLAEHKTQLLMLQAQKVAWSSFNSSPALGRLRVLQLVDCSSLTSFDGIRNLKQLQRLEVVGCPKLAGFDSIKHLTALEQLRLDNTPVTQLPEGIRNLQKLQMLQLSDCPITRLPSSLSTLSSLQAVHILTCRKLESLPERIFELPRLQHFMLENFNSLSHLPSTLTVATQLELLRLRCTADAIPLSFGVKPHLTALHLWECLEMQQLPESISRLCNLRELILFGCKKLTDLSYANLCSFTELTLLWLDQCEAFTSLPDSISCLTSLQTLSMKRCDQLTHVPGQLGALTALQILDLSSCRELRQLPESLGQLQKLQELLLPSCNSLEQLPHSIGGMRSLTRLDMAACYSVTLEGRKYWEKQNLVHYALELAKQRFDRKTANEKQQQGQQQEQQYNTAVERWGDDGVSLRRLLYTVKSRLLQVTVQVVCLADYSINVYRVDEQQQQQQQQQRRRQERQQQCQQSLEEDELQQQPMQLAEGGSYGVTGLPGGLCQLAALQQLDATGCFMVHLPASFGSMTALKAMHLNGCHYLQQLPATINCLVSLQQLELAGCAALQSLPQLPGHLTLLRLGGCTRLIDLTATSSAQKLLQIRDIRSQRRPSTQRASRAASGAAQRYGVKCHWKLLLAAATTAAASRLPAEPLAAAAAAAAVKSANVSLKAYT
uniref:Uncharacterized protein n=1 Tax=Tetradesmus obliquus TaxID=3088 RepID=A0A383WLM0_TETOB|eukprot:jgi/Sobl393_1/9763/SZX78122.1